MTRFLVINPISSTLPVVLSKYGRVVVIGQKDDPFYWKIKYIYGFDTLSFSFPPNMFDFIVHESGVFPMSALSWVKETGRIITRSHIPNLTDEGNGSLHEYVVNKKVKENYWYGISIFHPNVERDGITQYAKHLAKRLTKAGFDVIENKEKDGYAKIVEYEPGANISLQPGYIEAHSYVPPPRPFNAVYMLHDPRFFTPTPWYYVPHIAYDLPKVEYLEPPSYDFCSFGFAGKYKGFEKIERLPGKKALFVSVNEFAEKKDPEYVKLLEKYKSLVNVDVFIKDFFSEEELIRNLSMCKRVVFFEETNNWSSGSYRFASSLGLPVYAIENCRSREAQVFRFKNVEELLKIIDKYDDKRIDYEDGLDYIINVIRYG